MMEKSVPRIMIAGTGSGCGKTAITCALLKAFQNRGLKVGSFKCGPDYIDPMFHDEIFGSECSNLDSYFMNNNTLRYLMAKHSSGKDVNIIEGVMGYYDGIGIDSTDASSYEISQETQTPVILVIDAKGSALSTLAVLKGFLDFEPDNTISGVIFNRCSETIYAKLSDAVRTRFGEKIIPFGYLPKMQNCTIESRHLGLVTAAEIMNLQEIIKALSSQIEKSVDLDAILHIASQSPDIEYEPIENRHYQEKIRIAIAKDQAFCFYYRDNLEMLQEMGAELIPFSPLYDSALPSDIHGLYVGGGYPELYAEKISANESLRMNILEKLQSGIPCIAECGGYMYLTQAIDKYPMVGYLPGTCYNTGKLCRFGYVQVKSSEDNLLCYEGDVVRGHEFHYWDCSSSGNVYNAEKRSGKSWKFGYGSDSFYAGFPHFHFYTNPSIAERFYEKCLEYKTRLDNVTLNNHQENAHD